MLEELKIKYKTVYTIIAPLNDEETEHATIYLKKPAIFLIFNSFCGFIGIFFIHI